MGKKKLKEKFYIVYSNGGIEAMQWPESWKNKHQCRANIPAMLNEVLNIKSTGSEIKLIWNDWHRSVTIKNNDITYSDLDNYLKAESGMLWFISEYTRQRAIKALSKLGATDMVCVDNYRDVILYQAHFRLNKKFPNT